MFQHRELGLVQAYQIGATVVISAVFWLYYALLNYCLPDFSLASTGSYCEYFIAIILAFEVSFVRSKHKDVFSITSGILESHRFIWPHILLAGGITCMYLVLMRDTVMSRLFLFTFLPVVYVALVLFSRYLALPILRRLRAPRAERLLLVGTPRQVETVDMLLKKASLFGLETVGLATDAEDGEIPPGLRKLGRTEDLSEIIKRENIGNIFIVGSPRDRRMLVGWMRIAEDNGCRVSLVNDLDIFLERRLSYFSCNDIDLIELREEPLQNLVNRIIKRSFDLAVAVPIVLFVLPVLTVWVWLLQCLQAPGPILFRQTRSGLDNHPFTILKFRTMYADQCDLEDQAKPADGRVFPAGRFLRRFSIDEFPQFLNVVRGDMSVIGPRPHMPQHDAIFAQRMNSYRVRKFVKPGITGLAQMQGFRGEAVRPEDITARVDRDLTYIETWSFPLDIRILWRTALHLLRPPESAY